MSIEYPLQKTSQIQSLRLFFTLIDVRDFNII